MHLIFNMMTFWFFAFLLERRIGGAAFGVLYFGSLVLAVSTTYFKHRNDPRYGRSAHRVRSRPCCSLRSSTSRR